MKSRVYTGFATTHLDPEPFAYESGFAVKWVIEAQINQRRTGRIDPIAGDLITNAPFIAWGPYLWGADSQNPPGSQAITWLVRHDSLAMQTATTAAMPRATGCCIS